MLLCLMEVMPCHRCGPEGGNDPSEGEAVICFRIKTSLEFGEVTSLHCISAELQDHISGQKKKRNLPSGKLIHVRVPPVCTTQDSFSFTAFALAFAVHHLGSLFFLTASTVAVALGLLSYLFKYISFFVANNDLSCLFKEFITPHKFYNKEKEICKKPFGFRVSGIDLLGFCFMFLSNNNEIGRKEKVNSSE